MPSATLVRPGGVFEIALVSQGIAEAEMHDRGRGMEFERAPAHGDRLVELPLFPERIGQIARRLRMVRLQLKRTPARGNGLVEPAPGAKSLAQVGIRRRVVWIDGNGLLHPLHGQIVPAKLVSHHAEEMPGLGMLGLRRGCR